MYGAVSFRSSRYCDTLFFCFVGLFTGTKLLTLPFLFCVNARSHTHQNGKIDKFEKERKGTNKIATVWSTCATMDSTISSSAHFAFDLISVLLFRPTISINRMKRRLVLAIIESISTPTARSFLYREIALTHFRTFFTVCRLFERFTQTILFFVLFVFRRDDNVGDNVKPENVYRENVLLNNTITAQSEQVN